MAITGTIAADFDAFRAACTGATDDLRKMEDASKGVAKSLDDATKTSPANLKNINNETKAISGNMGSLLGTLGQFAPQLAAAFSVKKLIDFGVATVQMADATQRLATQLNLSTDEVQDLQAVAVATSTPMNTLSSSMQNLQQQLGSGDAGLRKAVRDLGLEFNDLRRMSPWESYTKIADAIRGIADPLQQAAAAEAVYGKNWRELLPAIKAGVSEVAEGHVKMSKEAIDALARLQARWNELVAGVKVAAGEMLGQTVRAMEAQRLDPSGRGNEGLDAANAAAAAAKRQIDWMRQVPEVAGFATDSLNSMTAGWSRFGAALPPITLSEQQLADEHQALLDMAERLTPEYKAWEAATQELTAAGDGWRGTLDGISGSVVEAIKYYLDAGVAQGTLATSYQLSAVQVKAVASALAAEAEARKKANAEADASLKAHEAEMRQYAEVTTAIAQSEQRALEADATAKEYYEKRVADAQRAYDAALKHGDSYVDGRVAQFERELAEAKAHLDQWQVFAKAAMDGVKVTMLSGEEEMRRSHAETMATVDQALKKTAELKAAADAAAAAETARRNQQYSLLTTAPSPESLYAAARVPGSMLGFGVGPSIGLTPGPDYGQRWIENQVARINANGPYAGGFNMQAGAVQINYPIMDDPAAKDQIGRLVGDAILSRLTRSGL